MTRARPRARAPDQNSTALDAANIKGGQQTLHAGRGLMSIPHDSRSEPFCQDLGRDR